MTYWGGVANVDGTQSVPLPWTPTILRHMNCHKY